MEMIISIRGACRTIHCIAREQATLELDVPSHSWPAGQLLHAVRVVWSPPPVKEPGLHAVQFAAPAALNLLSVPHGVTALPP